MINTMKTNSTVTTRKPMTCSTTGMIIFRTTNKTMIGSIVETTEEVTAETTEETPVLHLRTVETI